MSFRGNFCSYVSSLRGLGAEGWPDGRVIMDGCLTE